MRQSRDDLREIKDNCCTEEISVDMNARVNRIKVGLRMYKPTTKARESQITTPSCHRQS